VAPAVLPLHLDGLVDNLDHLLVYLSVGILQGGPTPVILLVDIRPAPVSQEGENPTQDKRGVQGLTG